MDYLMMTRQAMDGFLTLAEPYPTPSTIMPVTLTVAQRAEFAAMSITTAES